MIWRLLILTLILTACGTAASVSPEVAAIGVPFPTDYRETFHHYVTVERPDATIRNIYINDIGLDGLRRARRLPHDSVIVIEGYNAQVDADGDPLLDERGRYIKGEPFPFVHVAHRRHNWTMADFPSEYLAGAWNFGSFQFGSSEPFDENLTDCFNCHQAVAHQDFIYSAPKLFDFAATNETGYFFCNLRRRSPC